MSDPPTEGSVARPVSLDPFQNITDVGWKKKPPPAPDIYSYFCVRGLTNTDGTALDGISTLDTVGGQLGVAGLENTDAGMLAWLNFKLAALGSTYGTIVTHPTIFDNYGSSPSPYIAFGPIYFNGVGAKVELTLTQQSTFALPNFTAQLAGSEGYFHSTEIPNGAPFVRTFGYFVMFLKGG